MKRVAWADRKVGDIFLYHGAGLLSSLIRAAELAMHPDAPEDVVPSHAGAIGPDDTAVEARMDEAADSVAAIQPASTYNDAAAKGRVELWRPTTDASLADAVISYIHTYGPMRYGELNLLGFEWKAIVEGLFHIADNNPIRDRLVCSQGIIILLGKFMQLSAPLESWAWNYVNVPDNIANCDPLELRLLFLAHQR